MKQLLLIHPHDDSSSFLLKPFNLLQERFTTSTFYKIYPTEDSHVGCLSLVEKFDNIVFMGHGSHSNLCGARTSEYYKQDFLSYKTINEMGKRTWILFSCNSSDLLKRCPDVNAVGFGNLPTSMDEVWAEKESDVNAYNGVTSKVIDSFKDSINWLIIESITSMIEESLSIRDLYNRCSLLITKRMIQSLIDPFNPEQRALVNLLFEMKSQLSFVEQKV